MLPNEMAYPPEGMDGKAKRNFAATPEDTYRNLAQYYDIPALSFRDATYQLGDGKALGFSWESFMGPDRLHPNDLGHKVKGPGCSHRPYPSGRPYASSMQACSSSMQMLAQTRKQQQQDQRQHHLHCV
jgi:hypothetical protein